MGIIEHLEEHGPTARRELPDIDIHHRMNGVAVFKFNTRSRGEVSTPAHTEGIVYLFDSHDKVDVAREWIEQNTEYVDIRGDNLSRVVASAAGKHWSDAFSQAQSSSPEPEGESESESGPEGTQPKNKPSAIENNYPRARDVLVNRLGDSEIVDELMDEASTENPT